MHTPASVHFGTAVEIRARCQTTLDQPPRLPEQVWINQPAQYEQPGKIHCLI
jgi:putative transposase